MHNESSARAGILAGVNTRPEEHLSLSRALNRFSASLVRATVPLPGFDNSSMDGYAVRAEDVHVGAQLKVSDEQPAGVFKKLTLEPNTAIRIFTGAPMPAGADAVIMQEDVIRDAEMITCNDLVSKGENVRRQGADLCAGQQILARGEKLTPGRLALLASQGLDQVAVYQCPKVAILTTGDELVPHGQTLQQGQLYNSNGILLQSLVAQCGLAQANLVHIPDDFDCTVQTLRKLTTDYDFVIISGGVSVGDHDHVKPALKALDIPPQFWRVKIKPGKPLLHSTFPRPGCGACQIFGLPGNPVSSYVTFLLFVRPALLKSMGAAEVFFTLPTSSATLAQPLRNDGDRPHYLRGRLENGLFHTAGLQQSHALFGLSQSNALLRLQPDDSLPQGESVIVYNL